MTGTTSARQVYLINEFVNRYCFSLSSHKQLLINLMAVVSDGRPQRYAWLKRKGKIEKRNMTLEVIKKYYNYSTAKASDTVNILSEESILRFATELGYQKDDIKKLKKELNVK